MPNHMPNYVIEPYLSVCFDRDDMRGIEDYIADGGYEALRKTLTRPPEDIVEDVKQSGLRGRGGAGFPTGVKWTFLPKDNPNPVYLACNADESEPGTFKDRQIIEKDPHQLIEGIIISAYAVKCHRAYIYIRGEFALGAKRLERAIAEARDKGFLGANICDSGFELDISVYRGAGAYICGEETGLLSSLEGGRGNPRLKPPFPAIKGFQASPTIVNNVETLAAVTHIMRHGVEWFTSIGVERATGPKLYGVSGHVAKPGVYELSMDITLRELIYDVAGGVKDGKKLKAVHPGGSSSPVLAADELDVKMTFDDLQKAGSMLGSAGVIVMDDETCMVNALWNLARFYAHETCGQCTQCREGTYWMAQLLGNMKRGAGRSEDLEILDEVAGRLSAQTICVLADSLAMPAASYLKKFHHEFEAALATKH